MSQKQVSLTQISQGQYSVLEHHDHDSPASTCSNVGYVHFAFDRTYNSEKMTQTVCRRRLVLMPLLGPLGCRRQPLQTSEHCDDGQKFDSL